MLRDRVTEAGLVTKAQLPGMADEACKVDGWRQGYDEEMGAKTTPLSLALPPRSPVIKHRIHSNFVPVIVADTRRFLTHFSALKTQMITEATFVLETRSVLTKTI